MAFSILIVIPISINAAVAYVKTVDFIEDKSAIYEKEITRQINTTIDNYLENVDSLSVQTAYSELMMGILQKNYENNINAAFEESNDNRTAGRYLQTMRKTLSGIGNIFIYNTGNKGYFGFVTGSINPNYNIKDEKWYARIRSSDGGC